jgi:hypothetical protein
MDPDTMSKLRKLSQLLTGSSLIASNLDVVICSSKQNPSMNWHDRDISISRLQALLFVLDNICGTSPFLTTGLSMANSLLRQKIAKTNGRSKISEMGAHMYNQEFQPFGYTEGGTRFQQGVSMSC